jgi:hypothetical protein
VLFFKEILYFLETYFWNHVLPIFVLTIISISVKRIVTGFQIAGVTDLGLNLELGLGDSGSTDFK